MFLQHCWLLPLSAGNRSTRFDECKKCREQSKNIYWGRVDLRILSLSLPPPPQRNAEKLRNAVVVLDSFQAGGHGILPRHVAVKSAVCLNRTIHLVLSGHNDPRGPRLTNFSAFSAQTTKANALHMEMPKFSLQDAWLEINEFFDNDNDNQLAAWPSVGLLIALLLLLVYMFHFMSVKAAVGKGKDHKTSNRNQNTQEKETPLLACV